MCGATWQRHEFASGKLREKAADRANDETQTGDELVDEWADQGRAREFLEPMLRDADPEVRFAAASHLLFHRGASAAVPVLQELQCDPTMIGPTAWLRLLQWRRDTR